MRLRQLCDLAMGVSNNWNGLAVQFVSLLLVRYLDELAFRSLKTAGIVQAFFELFRLNIKQLIRFQLMTFYPHLLYLFTYAIM